MKTTGVQTLKEKICGKKIVSVAPSQWAGEVQLLSKNHDYVTMELEDGTILEISGIYLHEKKKIADSHTNP